MAGLPRLTGGLKLGYAVGSVGTGVFSTIPGLLLLYYMTDTLGIPAELAGLAVFLPKLWDVVTDPLMGLLSDRTQTRWGRRRPWMLGGALVLPPMLVAMFSVPDLGDVHASFVWVMVAYAAAATAFTAFSVPYVAMPAEMTEDPEDTTRLVSWRIAALTVGILLSGAAAPMLIELGGSGRAGYRLMALAIGGVCLVAMLGCVAGTGRARWMPPRTPKGVGELPREVGHALRNRPFVVLVLAYIFAQMALGALLAGVPYYADHVLGGGGDTVTLLFVGLVLPAALVMPLWVWLAARLGKRGAYWAALLVFSAAAGAVWAVGPTGSLAVVMPVVVVMGVAYAGVQILPFSMLPDTQRLETARSGENREGVFTGLWMAADKWGLALGALAASQVLAQTGFVEAAGPGVVQPASAVAGIVWMMGAVPCVALLVGAVVLWGYRLPTD